MNDMTKKGATMGDEDLYLRATREADSEERDAALWAKVIVLADGNAEKARLQYIKLRVDQLESERVQPKTEGKPLPKPDAIVRRARPAPPAPVPTPGEESRNNLGALAALKNPVIRFLIGALLLFALIYAMVYGFEYVYSYRVIQELTSSSSEGDAQASATLSRLYYRGEAWVGGAWGKVTVTKDINAALKWLKLAAAQGHLGAAWQLGVMCNDGVEVPQDADEAKRWYLQAAKMGDGLAVPELRMKSYKTDDCKDASKWLTYEANRGNAVAQMHLEKIGGKVTKDCREETLKWARPAAEQGDAAAQSALGWELSLSSYGSGQSALAAKDEALKWLRAAALQGHAQAQLQLGVIYKNDYREPNYSEALKWYRLAAEQGDPEAQTNLGELYEEGKGVAQDYSEALRLYRLAAEQGYAYAQSRLGYMYWEGKGVAQSDSEAVKWWHIAAAHGYSWAWTNLGLSYLNGRGVRQDYAEAVKLFRMRAESGDSQAAYYLGLCYLKGQGVLKDQAEAIGWLRLAAASNYKDAGELLDELGVKRKVDVYDGWDSWVW